MRGSAAFRVSVAPGGGLAPSWVRDSLSRNAGASPSLDLRFADSKSLVDSSTGANLVTFTRASSGTYVGSDGLIKTATTNLLLRSEEFDNAAWTKNDGPTVTANQITAPNGTITADQIVGNGAATGYLEQAIPITNGLSYVFSIYLKKRTASTVNTLLYGSQFNSGGGNQVATWNLDTGIASFTNGATGSMTAVGNDWFRCVMRSTATTTNASSANQLIRLVGNSGDAYIWGAQLEQSSTVGEYIPTTSTINSAPRFDHNPTTGESLGLLVEEQRTNNVLQSNGFDTTWSSTASVRTAAQAVSPEGVNNGWKLINDANNANHNIFQNVSFSAIATTFSVFVKYLDHRWVGVRIGAIGSQFFGSWDLQNGVVGSATAGASIGMQAYGNGWYRLTFTATLTTAGSGNLIIGLNNVDAVSLTSYAGSGTGIYLWGAQLEAGSFPTSYIPTTTAAATRSADVASITGANFSSWYNQTEGTVFCNYQTASNPANNFASQISDNSYSNRVVIGQDAGNVIGQVIVSNSLTLQPTSAPARSNNAMRQAFGFALNSAQLSLNGTLAVEDTSGAMTTALTRLDLGSDHGGFNRLNGTIRRLTYWPSRLPNATLQQITR